MKKIKIEYPDGTIHDVTVNNYFHSKKYGCDAIGYTLEDGRVHYTPLISENGKIFKNPEHTMLQIMNIMLESRNTQLAIDINKLPSYIPLYDKKNKYKTNIQPQRKMIIYYDEHNNYYLDKEGKNKISLSELEKIKKDETIVIKYVRINKSLNQRDNNTINDKHEYKIAKASNLPPNPDNGNGPIEKINIYYDDLGNYYIIKNNELVKISGSEVNKYFIDPKIYMYFYKISTIKKITIYRDINNNYYADKYKRIKVDHESYEDLSQDPSCIIELKEVDKSVDKREIKIYSDNYDNYYIDENGLYPIDKRLIDQDIKNNNNKYIILPVNNINKKPRK